MLIIAQRRFSGKPPDRGRFWQPQRPFWAPAASAAVMPQGAAVCGDRGGQMKRGPRRACAVGHSSTFHRRKVDRKAAGGPLYQGRNAPRSPPFAHTEDGFCCTPAPRLPRGFAFPQRKPSSPAGSRNRHRGKLSARRGLPADKFQLLIDIFLFFA